MDNIDRIIKLKKCFKALEEINPEGVYPDLNKAKTKLTEKILEIVNSLDVDEDL